MKFRKDSEGRIEKVFEAMMRKKFPDHSRLRYLYVWRLGHKKDPEGGYVIASVQKLHPRDRDVFGVDVRIEVDKKIWEEFSPDERKATAFHELQHIVLPEEEKKDAAGRQVFKLRKHNLVIRRFKEELEEFGMDKDSRDVYKFLRKMAKKEDGHGKDSKD